MIAPLRKRHRNLTVLLLLTVPALAALAIAWRPAVPLSRELPAVLAGGNLGDQPLLLDRDDLFTGPAVKVRLWSNASLRIVELRPLEPLGKPDVLAYWSAEAPGEETSLPPDAYQLGPVVSGRARAFPLPHRARRDPGHLILYSLGYGEVVGRASLAAPSEPVGAATGGGGSER